MSPNEHKELLANVESLINLNIGNIPRLTHIKESLQSGKDLYMSDRNYLNNVLAKAGLVDSKVSEVKQPSEVIPEKPAAYSKVSEVNQSSKVIPEKPTAYSKVNESNQLLEVPSKLWYLAHIFFSIITGLICYILWKDKNPKMAKKHLICSIPLTFVPMIWILLLVVLSQFPFIFS